MGSRAAGGPRLRAAVTRFGRLPRLAGLLALFGLLAADTPSLLPRPWYFQGLIGGISALIFYAIGVLVAAVWRVGTRWSQLEVSVRPEARRVVFVTWYALLGLGLLTYPLLNLSWHREVTSYVGQPTPGPFYPVLSVLAAIMVLAVFVLIFRLVAGLTHWLTPRIRRRVVRQVTARVIAAAVTVLIVGAVVDQVIIRGLLGAAEQQAERVDAHKPNGLAAPTTPLRSGGPGSLVPWSSIGSDGSTFVSSGPTQAQIKDATGGDAKEPIRIFAAIDAGRSLEQTRDLALAEVDRTGALDRKAILVVTSTSTGFVNEWASASFEYLLRGDTAIVTMQYSTLPSALSPLTAQDQPPAVGKMLFDGVAARVQARPADRRPRLYAGGESLGAYGGNGAFSSAADLLAKVDGAVWTGTPSFTPLRDQLTTARAFGSTVTDPVIDNGAHIRFAASPKQLAATLYGQQLGPWQAPRVVYLQHDTDPVVWWSTDLILHTPRWLTETRPPGSPMSHMSWLPFVTFCHVTADMAMANTVPGGFGHRYFEGETVPAWAGVLGMPTDADYSGIEKAINAANEG